MRCLGGLRGQIDALSGPVKERVGAAYFASWLKSYGIAFEQDGFFFNCPLPRSGPVTQSRTATIHVKTTGSEKPQQYEIVSALERAQLVVFAFYNKPRSLTHDEPGAMVLFRGFASRKWILRTYKETSYKMNARAYRVSVSRLEPITDLLDWLYFHQTGERKKVT